VESNDRDHTSATLSYSAFMCSSLLSINGTAKMELELNTFVQSYCILTKYDVFGTFVLVNSVTPIFDYLVI